MMKGGFVQVAGVDNSTPTEDQEQRLWDRKSLNSFWGRKESQRAEKDSNRALDVARQVGGPDHLKFSSRD